MLIDGRETAGALRVQLAAAQDHRDQARGSLADTRADLERQRAEGRAQGEQLERVAKQLEDEQRSRDTQQQQVKKAEHKNALRSTFEVLHSSKREEVKHERRVKQQNAEMLRATRDYELERAKKARESIRAHQKAVKERFEKQRQAHQEFLAQDFIHMIAMEDRRRDEIEKDIAAMEIEERQHIDRLRALQERLTNGLRGYAVSSAWVAALLVRTERCVSARARLTAAVAGLRGEQRALLRRAGGAPVAGAPPARRARALLPSSTVSSVSCGCGRPEDLRRTL